MFFLNRNLSGIFWTQICLWIGTVEINQFAFYWHALNPRQMRFSRKRVVTGGWPKRLHKHAASAGGASGTSESYFRWPINSLLKMMGRGAGNGREMTVQIGELNYKWRPFNWISWVRVDWARVVWIPKRSKVRFKWIDLGENRLQGGGVILRKDESNWVNTRFREVYIRLGCETETGVVRILVIFQDRPMFSHINGELSPRPFQWYVWT